MILLSLYCIRFEEKFNLDENGLPRRWKQADDVKKMFLDARVQALIVLDQFAFLRLNPAHDSVKFVESNGENVDESLVIISGEECQQLKDKFEKESNTSYLQALRDQACGCDFPNRLLGTRCKCRPRAYVHYDPYSPSWG